LALHLLVGAAFSGSRVPSLTKTDLEDSISGYGQEFFTLHKAKKSVNAFLSFGAGIVCGTWAFEVTVIPAKSLP